MLATFFSSSKKKKKKRKKRQAKKNFFVKGVLKVFKFVFFGFLFFIYFK